MVSAIVQTFESIVFSVIISENAPYVKYTPSKVASLSADSPVDDIAMEIYKRPMMGNITVFIEL